MSANDSIVYMKDYDSDAEDQQEHQPQLAAATDTEAANRASSPEEEKAPAIIDEIENIIDEVITDDVIEDAIEEGDKELADFMGIPVPKNSPSPNSLGDWFLIQPYVIVGDAMFPDTTLEFIRQEAQHKLDEIKEQLDKIFQHHCRENFLDCPTFHPVDHFFATYAEAGGIEMPDGEDLPKTQKKKKAAAVTLQALALAARFAYAGGKALAEKEVPAMSELANSLDPPGADFSIISRQLLTYVMSYAPLRDELFELHPMAKALFSCEHCFLNMDVAQLVYAYLRCTAIIVIDETLKDYDSIIRKLAAIDPVWDRFRPQAATYMFNAPFKREEFKGSLNWVQMFGRDGCQTKVAHWTKCFLHYSIISAAKEKFPEQFEQQSAQEHQQQVEKDSLFDDISILEAERMKEYHEEREKAYHAAIEAEKTEAETEGEKVDAADLPDPNLMQIASEHSHSSIHVHIGNNRDKSRSAVSGRAAAEPSAAIADVREQGSRRASSRERKKVSFHTKSKEEADLALAVVLQEEEKLGARIHDTLLPDKLAGKSHHHCVMMAAGKLGLPGKGGSADPKSCSAPKPCKGGAGLGAPNLQQPQPKGKKAVPVGMEHQLQRLMMGGLDPRNASKSLSKHPLEYDHSIISSYDDEPVNIRLLERQKKSAFSNIHGLGDNRAYNKMLIHDGSKMNMSGPLLGKNSGAWLHEQKAVENAANIILQNPAPPPGVIVDPAAFQTYKPPAKWAQKPPTRATKKLEIDDDVNPNYHYLEIDDDDEVHPGMGNSPLRQQRATSSRPHNPFACKPHGRIGHRDSDQEREARMDAYRQRLRKAEEEIALQERLVALEERMREARRAQRAGPQHQQQRERHADRMQREQLLPDPLEGMLTLRTQVAPEAEEVHENLNEYLEEARSGAHATLASNEDMEIPAVLYPRIGFVYHEREKVASPKLQRHLRQLIGVYIRARGDEQTANGDFSSPPIDTPFLHAICQRSTIIWLINEYDNHRKSTALEIVVNLAANGLMERKCFEKMVDTHISSGEKPKLDNTFFVPYLTTIKKDCQETLEELVSRAVSNSGNMHIPLRIATRELYAKLRIAIEKVRKDVLPVSAVHHLDPQTADQKNAKALVDAFSVANMLTMLIFQVGGFWRSSLEMQTARYHDWCQRIHAHDARLTNQIGRKNKVKVLLEFTDRLETYGRNSPSVTEVIQEMMRWLDVIPDAGRPEQQNPQNPAPPQNPQNPPGTKHQNKNKGGGGGGNQQQGGQQYGGQQQYHMQSGWPQQQNWWQQQNQPWGGYQRPTQQQYQSFSYGTLPQAPAIPAAIPSNPAPGADPNKKRPADAGGVATEQKFKTNADGNRTEGSYVVERLRNEIQKKTGVPADAIQKCKGMCTFHLAHRCGVLNDKGEVVCCPAGENCKKDKKHAVANGFFDEHMPK